MRTTLDDLAPRFVAMAHAIGYAVCATVDAAGHVHTRVVQPVWRFDGGELTGWFATSTKAPKAADLAVHPTSSITWWNPEQDTCTADCDAELLTDPDELAAAWDRFLETPPPAGYDPAIAPEWDSPASPTFGVVRLTPRWLRVMPGTLMTAGEGEVRTWRRPGT